MWVRRGSLCVALLAGWLVAGAEAQEGIRWQPSLESAKHMAGQSNRLVLLHFWADWCRPCMAMEREVFSRPDVAGAVEADYVAVKIHKDHFPATARQYGVTAIPCDVILTPQGQVVQKFEGASDAGRYVNRLNQVAASYRAQSGRVYAQIGPSARPEQPAAPPRQPNLPPRFGPSAGVDVAQAQVPQDYGPIANPHAPAAVPMVAQSIPNPPYRGGAAAPPEHFSQAPMTPPLTSPPASVAPSPPWQGPPLEAAIATGPIANVTPTASTELPAGNPPLALDGYCPVQLTEKERWVLGNRRWGVRHEGRTYLFAGPEEQSRFYADPDRYAPAMSGDDLVALVDQGQRVPGRREHGAWFEGRVYLFSSEAALQKFSTAPERYVSAVAEMKARLASRSERALPPSTPPSSGAPWQSPQMPTPVPVQYR